MGICNTGLTIRAGRNPSAGRVGPAPPGTGGAKAQGHIRKDKGLSGEEAPEAARVRQLAAGSGREPGRLVSRGGWGRSPAGGQKPRDPPRAIRVSGDPV